MSASAVLHSMADVQETVRAQAEVTREMRLNAEAFLAENSLTLDDAFKMVIEAASMRMGIPTYWLVTGPESREDIAAVNRGEVTRVASMSDLIAQLETEDDERA